jgi:cation diffusion facilitator family transporter
MHTHTLDAWQHEHVFLGARHDENKRRSWLVVGLTATMMIVEIVGGMMFGSMALIADGWHMSTHAGALALAALAYGFARKHAHNERFAFGTGKVGELAGFASALILAMIALLIACESALRLFNPVAISFDWAIAIAAVGLAVNLGSAWLLRGDEHHQPHAHRDKLGHRHHVHDHNLRGAYLHVLADALTSVLAIVALLSGRLYGSGVDGPDDGYRRRLGNCLLVIRASHVIGSGVTRYRPTRTPPTASQTALGSWHRPAG